MNIKDYIREHIKKKDLKNLYEVQYLILLYFEGQEKLPKWLEYKVNRLAEKYNIKPMEILANALINKIAAINLIKKANRQNFAEKLQFKYLREVRKINIKKLPSNGIGSIRLKNGDFILDSFKAPLGATKSLDAVYKTDLIMLKYIEEPGGSQDNQISTIIHFLREAQLFLNKYKNRYNFVAIVDGNYIESKLDGFHQFTNDRIIVCTSDTYRLECDKHFSNLGGK